MSRTATYQGYEVNLYPLDNVGITAGPDAVNHIVTGVSDTGLWDNGWHVQQNDPLYAPCTMEYTAYSSSGNTQMFRSVNPVWIPGYSSPQYVTMSFSHSNTLYYTTIGDIVTQGAHFYDTGTYGIASGAHVHMCLMIGSRSSIWPVGQNPTYGGIFYSPNPPADIAAFFYVPEDATISSGWGLDWTRWEGLPEFNAKIAIINLLLKRRKKKGGVLYGIDTGLVRDR